MAIRTFQIVQTIAKAYLATSHHLRPYRIGIAYGIIKSLKPGFIKQAALDKVLIICYMHIYADMLLHRLAYNVEIHIHAKCQ